MSRKMLPSPGWLFMLVVVMIVISAAITSGK